MWSQLALDHLVPVLPELIGGSADLTGSNGTRTKDHAAVGKGSFAGNYIHYGVREHGMAAAMNGMALSGGLIPYGGTFLVFTDYCRASIRLSALMRQRVIYVMTHDSIGLGEDGPTHQPVEHLAALRAIPHLLTLRPAEGVETAECWEIALKHDANPSVLALSRQAVDNLRKEPSDENLSAKGAYVLSEPEGGRDVTLIGTGSELGARRRSRQDAGGGRHPRRRRVDAVDGAVPRPARELSPQGARRQAARRRRSRCRAVLVRMARRQRPLRRPAATSVPRRRRRSSTSTSASRPMPSPKRPAASSRSEPRQPWTFRSSGRSPTPTCRASACSCAPTSTCRSPTVR